MIAYLQLSIAMVYLVAMTQAGGYPGGSYPYRPPLNAANQRSPCPALNTLANHGLINRSGKDIPLSDIGSRLQEAFGLAPGVTKFLFRVAKIRGLETRKSVTGEEVFDLVQLYKHNMIEHDASLVHKDHYFEPRAQYNDKLFAELARQAQGNMLTRKGVSRHQQQRIYHSRKTNPDVHFDPILIGCMAGEATAFMAFGNDPHLRTCPLDRAKTFLKQNRFPSDFVSRPERGFPALTLNPIGVFARTASFFLSRSTRILMGGKPWSSTSMGL